MKSAALLVCAAVLLCLVPQPGRAQQAKEVVEIRAGTVSRLSVPANGPL